MKANAHPTWNENAKVTCACGNSFTTGSTMTDIRVDICSKCHPLFTGQQKLVDTLGQVDKFQRKTEASQAKAAAKQAVFQARAEKNKDEKKERASLKDLLMQARKQMASS